MWSSVLKTLKYVLFLKFLFTLFERQKEWEKEGDRDIEKWAFIWWFTSYFLNSQGFAGWNRGPYTSFRFPTRVAGAQVKRKILVFLFQEWGTFFFMRPIWIFAIPFVAHIWLLKIMIKKFSLPVVALARAEWPCLGPYMACGMDMPHPRLGERERALPSLVHSAVGSDSQGCVRLMPGARNSIWVSHIDGRNSSTWTIIICCILLTLTRSWIESGIART